MEPVLDAIKEVQSILDDVKESIDGGLHLRLCNATLAAYERAEALQAGGEGRRGDDDDDDQEEEEGEESDEASDEEQSVERTENDMGLNELAELWGWNFDFGRRNAVLELEGLIETITMDDEEKRVCAAVRVLDRAILGSKPDDPADAERILEWKEELVEQGAIRACAEILAGEREFECSNDDDDYEPWMYSALCDEIIQLFARLAEDDALFRTKMRRSGVLKGLEKHFRENPNDPAAEEVLNMLRRRT